MDGVMIKKARAGYERTLGLGLAGIAGAPPLTWAEIETENGIVGNLVQKAEQVLDNPLAWIGSDDPRCVEFALGVIFDGDFPGTDRICWAPVTSMSPPFFEAMVLGCRVEMRAATMGEHLNMLAALHARRPMPLWFFGAKKLVVFRSVPRAYIEARVLDRLDLTPGAGAEARRWEAALDEVADRVAAVCRQDWGSA